ncbi:hypothetical protein [Streptomyces phaeoluteigriseus]|uniref:hypothetical protein n=1 Tax=Streptomyces phaeoluteigriseus TaxID=114686 RepID=UPI00117F2A95|nr:hypothetical protein [Streptomyces phaeoluteigriseus]
MPREHTLTFGSPQRTTPLYRCPVMYRCDTPGVALGCARGALSEFTARPHPPPGLSLAAVAAR